MGKLKIYSLVKKESDFLNVKLTSSQDVNRFIRQFYDSDIEIYESAFAVFMNRSNTTVGYVKISQGGIYSTIMDKVLIAKYAIDSLAATVIICHNHPSGVLTPSDSDIGITAEIKKGLDLFNIRLIDHMILTKNGFYSFCDEGIL